jgi:hypothetical protein
MFEDALADIEKYTPHNTSWDLVYVLRSLWPLDRS